MCEGLAFWTTYDGLTQTLVRKVRKSKEGLALYNSGQFF